MFDFWKKKKNDFIEYLEFDLPVKINEGRPVENEKIQWARITKRNNPGYYNLLSVILEETYSHDETQKVYQSIDEPELKRLKKLAKRNKVITFSNPSVINLAICGLFFAGVGLVLNAFINLDKIESNYTKYISHKKPISVELKK